MVYTVYMGYVPVSAQLATYADAVRWARDFIDSVGDKLASHQVLSVRSVAKTSSYVGRVDFNGNFHVCN